MAEKPKLLDACREALRVPADCTDFDAEIEDLMEAARAEMRAGGVSSKKSEDDDDASVRVAVKCYVKAHFGMDNPDAERLALAFDTMLTSMSGNSEYRGSA